MTPKSFDIPDRYCAWDLGSFSPGTVAEIDPFTKGQEFSAYLHGSVGSKKSSFAGAYLISLREKFPWAAVARWGGFVTWDAFRRACLDTKGVGGEKIKHWTEANLIVLDDIGRSRSTEHMIECYMMIINYRYDRMLPMILTSNCDLMSLTKFFHGDPNVSSRLSEGVVLDFGEKDFRQE